MKREDDEEKMRRQVALIHYLAVRLPWVVVAGVLLTAFYYILLAYLRVIIS